MQSVLRAAFEEWHALPERMLTDNEFSMAGPLSQPFDALVVRVGHRPSTHSPHQPTEPAQVERQHRTLDNFTANAARRTDLATLQAALDSERWVYNTLFPCRASECEAPPS